MSKSPHPSIEKIGDFCMILINNEYFRVITDLLGNKIFVKAQNQDFKMLRHSP